MMDKLKSILEKQKAKHQNLVAHPNFEKRLKWELIEIEVQDAESYFVDLHENNKKFFSNENNLLVAKLLDLVDDVDLDSEPATKTGEFPDVDVDYLPIVRDYLKNVWAPQEFGENRVCNIGNYGTFGIKSTLIDMARVHGLDRGEILQITTNIGLKDDDGQVLTFDKALEMYPELQDYCDRHPEVAQATQKLLYRNRSMGKHAGGLIICSDRIDNFVPLVRGTDGSPVSAWVEGLHGQDLGPVGLIKFDLLVVSGLYQIACTVRLVKERHNLEKLCATEFGWDWSDTEYLNDPQSISMANKGDLKCIFQYDSDGIRNLVRKAGIDSFDDLVAIVSLYRPGPLQMKMDETFCKRKRGDEKFELHPVLEPIVGSTYGVLVYQEQIMMILNAVGKIPLRDCYQVIKAISKKKLGTFSKYKDQFIANGQVILGKTEKDMQDYWSQIEAFSGYGFNKTLTEDTTIYCVGGIKQIKDVCAGDKVFCVNEQGEQTQTEVVAVHDHGVIDVVEVTFDDGYIVKCTLDHKFLTEEGQVPLWKIIKNNLDVLSSPLGEQNAKETKLGNELRGNAQQQKQTSRTSQGLYKVRRDISAKENRKIQPQISLWSEIPNQIQISRSFERMSGMHLFEMEGDGEKACIPLWNRILAGKIVSGASSSLRKMHGNKKEEYSRTHEQVERVQPCARNKSDIFCDCQENICEKRCAESQSSTIKEMERQQSGGICKVYRKGTAFSKEIKNGNVAKRFFELESNEGSVWSEQKICRFGKGKDLDRGRRAISFLANGIGQQKKGSQSGVHTSQRSGAQGRMSEKTECYINQIGHDLFSQENGGDETGMVGFTPKYASISNTGGLVCRRIVRVVPVGKRQCYDLEVAVSTHNFILPNGVITSNSHSTSYSYISARQLYLKSHYALEFYAATLMNEDGDEKKREYITEALNHGVTVEYLDLNKSKDNFCIVDNNIYLGFSNVKGIGEEKAKSIVALQPYKSFEDFLERFGTDTTVLRALIPLGVFKDAEPVVLYKFWQVYAEYQKGIKDKQKRFQATIEKTISELYEILPVSMHKLTTLNTQVFNVIKDYISFNKKIANGEQLLNVVRQIEKKFLAAEQRFLKNKEKYDIDKPVLAAFDPKSVEINDKKIIDVFSSKELAEQTYLGFVWENKIRISPDYKPNQNFDTIKYNSVANKQPYYRLMGEIHDVAVKTFKNGKGKFASIVLVDDNFEKNRVTFWEDDYDRFKAELKKGNLISIQVSMSTGGYQGYNFFAPPKWQRHLVPKEKKLDYRLVVMRNPEEKNDRYRN
jgi:hypothetical protein